MCHLVVATMSIDQVVAPHFSGRFINYNRLKIFNFNNFESVCVCVSISLSLFCEIKFCSRTSLVNVSNFKIQNKPSILDNHG